MADNAFDISPLDPRQHSRLGSIKQEDRQALHSVHSSDNAEYQVDGCAPGTKTPLQPCHQIIPADSVTLLALRS